MKHRILFLIGDSSLMPDFSSFKLEWDASVAFSTEMALQALNREPFEAVVTDAHTCAGGGIEALRLIATRVPQVTRLYLCDIGEIRGIKNDGTIQQFLVKPTTADAVISAAQRARLLATWMADAGLRKLFTQMRKLPSVPTVYFRLLEMLKSQDTSSEMVGEIIAEDPGLTIRVLQMVNSPLFGIGRTISSAAEAVGYLGLQRTQSLVLVSQAFAAGNAGPGASEIDRLWRHSLLTGDFAQRIARAASRETRVADESYTAGVLHDVGKLMLAANLPEEYEAIRRTHRESRRPLQTVEKEVLGASHAEVGACALTIWGLPSPIVEAIAYHHHPDKNHSRMFTPTIAVHAANAIAHEIQPDVNAPAVDKLDEIHLADLGLASQVAQWREICQRPPTAEG